MFRHSRSRAAFRIALLVLTLAPLIGGVSVAETRADAESAPVTPVDLNKADVEQLTGIPGIGPVTAARIVTWREENGPFRRVEDLLKVKGIGDTTFEKLRPYIKVGKTR